MTGKNAAAARLDSLRGVMAEEGIDLLIVPTADPHLSEYLPEYWQSRKYFSGFTGSAGTLLVCRETASLWTDSRYWVQAAEELSGSGIAMCRIENRFQLPYMDWIRENCPQGGTAAVDGRLVSVFQGAELKKALNAAGMALRTDADPVSKAWKDRPAPPEAKVFEHGKKFVRFSRAEKIAKIREKMAFSGAKWHLISALDEIAWLLNLRGSDIEYNPVFYSYLLIGPAGAVLMADKKKFPEEILSSLETENIRVEPYDSIKSVLGEIPAGGKLLLDPRKTPYAVYDMAGETVHIIEAANPAVFMKAAKEPSEIEHVRETMRQDGAAFCEFQAWFDANFAGSNPEPVTELTVAEKIEAFRSKRPHYISPSFGTIAGFNENGALPHYQATEKAFSRIEGNGLLLIDTGGQYLSGTTDMTRVIPVGTPSEDQKRDFTVVLKGVIALSESAFPDSLPAPLLDPIARKPLWAAGLDFGHGTGHGVGYFLNVHEGPQAISYRTPASPAAAMKEGMITSIEPGLYREGKWGIRIENLAVNRFFKETGFGRYLNFETLTQCPIDTRCIVKELLTAEEKAWLNRYHESVRKNLLPLVPEEVKPWLLSRTEAI